MTTLRLGTRGSDLALTQSRWFCDLLRKTHPPIMIEETIIKTHGDTAQHDAFDQNWPVGSFVSAIEKALLDNTVDFAVHSFKDLQTEETKGLTIAAIPGREDAHDALLSREPVSNIRELKRGFRVGTSSPRRAAQMRRLCPSAEIIPIRGNVPTRIAKIESENLDGVILAAAGMNRLNIKYPNTTLLPFDLFVPSPAQGALAIQTRQDTEAEQLIAVLDDPDARHAVTAERMFLAAIGAGCHTPAGALATMSDNSEITIDAQLFSDDASQMVECHQTGTDPLELGRSCATELLAALKETKDESPS